MWLKVRRGGISAVLILASASLVSTSTALAGRSDGGGRTLKLRVPLAEPGSPGAVAAWILGAGKAEPFRAAHALTEESGKIGSEGAGGGQVLMVTVTVGRGPRREVLTNAPTVGDLLGALGVRLHRLDVVKPAGGSPLGRQAMVRVVRVRPLVRTETVELPYQTLIQYSKELAPGRVKILAAGAPGLARLTYVVAVRNGRERSRTLVSDVVLTPPVSRVEEKGLGAPVVRPGVEFGEASWYDWYGCGSGSGSGYHAAHRTLPFGTAVTVTNLDTGRSVTVTINDRGPYVSGRIIDLCPRAFAALAPLGQGLAHVEIAW